MSTYYCGIIEVQTYLNRVDDADARSPDTRWRTRVSKHLRRELKNVAVVFLQARILQGRIDDLRTVDSMIGFGDVEQSTCWVNDQLARCVRQRQRFVFQTLGDLWNLEDPTPSGQPDFAQRRGERT